MRKIHTGYTHNEELPDIADTLCLQTIPAMGKKGSDYRIRLSRCKRIVLNLLSTRFPSLGQSQIQLLSDGRNHTLEARLSLGQTRTTGR